MRLRSRHVLPAALSCLALACSGGAWAQTAPPKKFKVALSMSYIGNDWQAEAANMIKAMAAHPSMASKVDLQVQVAGPDAQRQIQQINAMVQGGADAIVVYPISPTALNQVIRNACKRNVLIIAYDGEVTEPCAHNVTIDQEEAGRVTAEWLADRLKGRGNVVMLTGVPGTSVDEARTRAAKQVFARHPDIHVVAEAPGMWSQAVARTELSKILATQSWDRIDGLWLQVGCYTANTMQIEAGRKPDQLRPCAGEGSNGGRVQMLAAGTAAAGANGTYAPMAAPRISYASPPYSGALALKLAVRKLEGGEIPQRVTLPLPVVTNETVRLCQEGTWKEMADGCNAFMPSVVTNPGWFASIFSKETPEIGLQAALASQPEP